MGQGRRHPVFGRCLRRPPLVWRGRHRPSAGGRGAEGGHSAAARLARRPARLPPTGASAPVVRHCAGLHGLDGEQIHRRATPALRGRLLARRPPRHAPRVPHHRLLTNPAPALPRRAHCARRNRGQPAPPNPLRLLAGPPDAQHSAALGGRHDCLRHGRKAHTRDCPTPHGHD